ncbi:hypothetical protein EYR41_011501 [Orbilia oligospora]|uniref:Thioredoxin domain-containing protein n=1 Tax=Orbilia oligospora TaxID=2813651 RepID=A0A7C8P7N7_ORBOL|nr:hypothetical protein TWF751_000828 [Orbilia oligospora]TGJ63595.1 hypothetical protein EYR41_011501 [Orbilia oligospora]
MLLPILQRQSLRSAGLRRHCRLLHISKPRLRIFDPVRSEDGLYTLLVLSTSRRLPLITLWSASWCPSCHAIRPLIQDLVDEQAKNGLLLGFAEVEIDLPTTSSLASLYSIKSIPTMLAFHKGLALNNRIVDTRKAKDRGYLANWLRECAAAR